MSEDIFGNLFGLENGYVDCTPKTYSDWLLEHGTPIMVRGYARELQYKKIGPGVIRVSKVPLGEDEVSRLNSKIAALEARIAELTTMPGDEKVRRALESTSRLEETMKNCHVEVGDDARFVLAHSLRAAMVRLEEAEKELAAQAQGIKVLREENESLHPRNLSYVAQLEAKNRLLAEQAAVIEAHEKREVEYLDVTHRLEAALERARGALKKYSRQYGKDGKCWNWMDWVCDRYSGLVWHFDWPGEDQDAPWEYAERALASLPAPPPSPAPVESRPEEGA